MNQVIASVVITKEKYIDSSLSAGQRRKKLDKIFVYSLRKTLSHWLESNVSFVKKAIQDGSLKDSIPFMSNVKIMIVKVDMYNIKQKRKYILFTCRRSFG